VLHLARKSENISSVYKNFDTITGLVNQVSNSFLKLPLFKNIHITKPVFGCPSHNNSLPPYINLPGNN